MEDDDETTHSPCPVQTLGSDSVPPPSPSDDGGAPPAPETLRDAKTSFVSVGNGTERADDVAVPELGQGVGEGVGEASAFVLGGNETKTETNSGEDGLGELQPLDEGENLIVGDETDGKDDGELGGSELNRGDDVALGEAKSEGEGALESDEIVIEDKVLKDMENAMDLGGSGVITGDDVAVGEADFVKSGEDTASGSVRNLDNQQLLDEMVGDEIDAKDEGLIDTEKVGDLGGSGSVIAQDMMVGSETASEVDRVVGDEMDGKDEVLLDRKNVGDLGCSEPITGNDDVAVGETMSGEGDVLGCVGSLDEGEKLMGGDEVDGKDEVFLDTKSVGDLGDSEPITGNDDVEVGETKSVKEDVSGRVGSLDERKPLDEGEKLMGGEEMDGKDEVKDDVLVEGELIRSNDDVAMGKGEVLRVGSETKSEEEGVFGSVPRSGTMVVSRLVKRDIEGVKSSVVDDMAVDIEMETENKVGEEVKEGDAVVEKRDTEMETEKEVVVEVQEGDAVVEKGDTEMDTGKEVVEEVQEEDAVVEKRDNAPMEVDDEVADEGDDAMPEEDVDMEETADVNGVAGEEEKELKGKRGKNSRVPPKAPAKKVVEEDVCFICFDGGDLVLCDRRACPKAYHPSCVNRDEAFFRAKGRWSCGWHLCSICEKKAAHYMCYTCTFSLCKACSKDAVISCVRGNKGFCDACMKTVSLIENIEKGTNEDQVDFDDKSSWLYLFKDYWLNVKQKLSLSSDEIFQAKNPSKGSDASSAGKQESPDEAVDGSSHLRSSSDSEENLESNKSKKRKTKKRPKSNTKEETSPVEKEDSPPKRKLKRSATFGSEVTFKPDATEWASNELLEFVMHMKNGDKSAISQFDVQALLLEYIKTNKLRDPRRKSQIICDARLQSLFGKPRVGHFEMLKLLESHFLIKDNPLTDDNQGTVVDNESNDMDADGTLDVTPKGGKDRRRKNRKKGHSRGRQSNLDDYAAIDMLNIGLIFLRRKLVEDLLEDDETFCDKVVGTFVRIRISASTQKQDMYRLVQVLGTSKASEPYKVGKRTTDLMLEILNLNKKELVSIDTISNQDFTQEECTRLRQSIKCGLISRLTVGDILDKAMEIQAARVNDWLEAEVVRVSHLRDRASDLGRRKELREYVEKLQILKTPEERRRRLDEVPEIHADPNMDPDHESEDNSEEEEAKQDSFMKPRGSAFSRRGREPISPRSGNFSSVDSWSGSRQNSGKNYEVTRNLSHTVFSNKNDESASIGGNPIESSRAYIETQHANIEKAMSPIHSVNARQPSLPAVVPDVAIINESEKMWHYKDPNGKVQGPFSVVQLRKWSKNGYFPADLRIWKNTETEDDAILLTDALDGKFQKQLVITMTNPSPAQMGTNASWGSLSVEVSKPSANKTSNLFNLPSPTPNTSTPVWNIEQSSETQHPASSANSMSAQQNGSQEISPASLLNSARQLMSGLENGSSPVGPTITQPTTVTNETQGWGTQQMVVPYQTAPGGAQATVGATPQEQQQAGYNSWVGAVPTTVQNPSGNFPMPGYAAIPQQVPGQQPTFPGQVAPNVPWGMNMVQGNPNMVWGGYVQGAANMNWTPLVNSGWVAPNPGVMVNAMPPGNVNQGWVAQPVNQGSSPAVQVPSPGNVNQGWGNPGTNTQAPVPVSANVNQGWGTGTPPGNSNTGKGSSGGWGTPPDNSGGRRNDGYRSGNRFSGSKDRSGDQDRSWNRPRAAYDSHGNRICPFFLEGYCKKRDRCDMVHQNPPDRK